MIKLNKQPHSYIFPTCCLLGITKHIFGYLPFFPLNYDDNLTLNATLEVTFFKFYFKICVTSTCIALIQQLGCDWNEIFISVFL